MSIASRQVVKEVNRIVETAMKDGFIPTVEYIIAELGKYYAKVRVGFPSFQNRHQGYRKTWDVTAYNSNLSEIYDDINNLYEEIVSQFAVTLEDFDYAETERRKSYHQIQTLEDSLTNLLLVAEDTAGYLYSVYDNFIDTSKVDMGYTTCEVNVGAQTCTLRESRNGIKKIDMSHYYGIVNFPILASDLYSSKIVSNTIFSTTKFGDAFSNSNASWIQNIVASSPGKLEVAFTIDISPDNSTGEYISRIEMAGQSPNPMSIEPLWSIDNVNFQTLPMGYATNLKTVGDGKTTIWNFYPSRVRYIKFIIYKPQEDEAISNNGNPAYRYVIGFKNISIYKMAYELTSTLYSNPFTVIDSTGETVTVDKASLSVDQDVQQKTNIRYYLSLGASGVTDPTTFSWTPIGAVNDPITTDQKVVDFKHVSFFADVPDIQWNSSQYGTPLESANGVDFYTVYEFPYEPVRDSTILYRGKNNWQVTERYNVDRVSVYYEEHAFGSSDTITLVFPSGVVSAGEGLIRSTVVVADEQGSNPGFTYVNNSDYIVSYTQKTITRPTGSSISGDPTSPKNTVYVSYQYDKETVLPKVYTTYIYIMNPAGIDVNIQPWSSFDITNGNYTSIQTEGTTVDVSMQKLYHFAPGWHKIETTGEPHTSDDRFYHANGDSYLYDKVYAQYAIATQLQETSWFELRYNTMLMDHSKFCITDYYGNGTKMLIVNYRPQTTSWVSGLDLLCPMGTETYVISYKYIAKLNNQLYLRADLSRSDDSEELTTPTLHSYTIKIGY